MTELDYAKSVVDRKKAMGYGVGIRQCHDCFHSNLSFGEILNEKYRCLKGKFAVQKTGTCKNWKET